MPTTPRGFPYPSGSDQPNVPYWLQQLAEAVDEDVPLDTGWQELTWATGWDTPSGGLRTEYRRFGNEVWLRGTQRANSATIAAGTHVVGTLPVGSRPPGGYYGFVPGWISGGSGVSPSVEVVITSAGVLSVVVGTNLTGIRMHPVRFPAT